MIVYRTMSSSELLTLLGNDNIKDTSTIKGQNTFKYKENIEYIHFF